MHVQIDESRSHNAALGVERLMRGGFQETGRSQFGHAPVAQQNIQFLVDSAGGIDDTATGDEQSFVFLIFVSTHRAAFKTVARMAMRVFTPLATCSCMTDCGPSATSLASSRPRTIGPGCMTMASGRASFMRCGVT